MGSITATAPLGSIKRICVVGAGPTGLAATKYLVAEKSFVKIDVFEQQSEAGGVWNYSKETAGMVDIPQTTPHVPLEQPLALKDHKLVFPTAMYETLHTNIPKDLMKFSDKEFPKDSQLFPKRETVLEYIQQYAEDVKHLISYSTQVQDVKFSQQNGRDIWKVTTKDLIRSETREDDYDAVVVASGHYSLPYIPNVLGVQAWSKAFPGAITHSKFYRTPEIYQDKKVIIVGNHASGQDISSQILRVSAKPLLNSVVHKTDKSLPHGKEEVGVIEEYIVEDQAVRFADGRIEKNVDAVVYCTGYFFSYPFLESLDPPVVSDGRRVLGCYKYLFYSAHPTLAFTALPYRIIPFPFSEAQSAIVSMVWSNRLELPVKDAMDAWEKRTVEERGNGTSFDVLGYPLDANYINEMHDWTTLADGKTGKEPPRWGEKELWVRQQYLDILKAFVENGCTARTMEELGFDFEAHKKDLEIRGQRGA